ncbi:MAG TPA: hypothetical protein ENK78_08630 [Thiothrix sp.]|nr:hypothetical protein [Thiothrix sp.]
MGFDNLSKLGEGETATRAALPVWSDFMKYRLKGLEDKGWKKSDTLIRVKLDKKTGKLATDKSKAVIEERLDKPSKVRQKARPRNKKSEGFESFDKIPPELLNKPSNDEPEPRRRPRNTNRDDNHNRNSNRNDNSNRNSDNRSRSSAPTPKPASRPAASKPERVEIPEQLF